jgi:proline iminopeptidase
MRFILTVFSLLILTHICAQPKKDSIYYAKLSQPGTKMIPVYNGKYKVFTQKIGDGRLKLLLLHGGPANCHEYFENFPEYLLKQGFTIYYYDQLGSYYSDQPDDSSIWNIPRFVEEIEEVRKGLKLEQFYLLGHSWGGMLAELYTEKYQQHIKGLILSDVPSFSFLNNDSIMYQHFADSMEKKITAETKSLPALSKYKKVLLDSISAGFTLTDSILSNKINSEYSILLDSIDERTRFYHKSGTEPEPLLRNYSHINRAGRNKYKFTNQVQKPDYMKAVERIKVPTLIISAKYDYTMPDYYPKMKERMSKAKCRIYICPNGAHFAMWDDSENYFRELARFVKEVDGNSFNPDN